MHLARYWCARGRTVLAILVALAVCPLGIASSYAASSYYVAPNGSPSNDGSINRPLDLAKALSSSSPARPGDTIWLRGGTYSGNFTSELNGSSGAPIIVRQYPGERATLDGGANPMGRVLTVKGSYTWFWGFEVTNSSTNRTSGASSRGEGVMQYGPYTKLINLVVHDNLDGIGTWSGVTDGEVYGNVIYNNGADSGGIGAGHSIYVQNSTGTKHITDNVLSNSYNFGIHVYTEGGSMNNVSMEGNIAFNHGVLARSSSYKANYFVGGSQVAQNPSIVGNYGYYPFGSQGRNADLGWGTACSNLILQDNYLAGGTAAKINCSPATVNGNYFYGAVAGGTASAYPSNTYSTSKPGGVHTVIRPNRYEPGRANIAVYNWGGQSSVQVDISSAGLKVGDRFELRNAQNFFGGAVVTGTYTGSPITVPMVGLSAAQPIGASVVAPATGPEFNAFVLLPIGGSGGGPAPSAPTASLSASPATVTAGQSATLSWSTTNATSVSISPAVGAVSASGSATVTPSQTTTYTLTAAGSGGTTTKSATVTVSTGGGGSGGGGGSASASFVKTDTTTGGTWTAAYGKDGYAIAGDATAYPSYAQVSFGGAASWTWAGSASDTRALQRGSGSGRLAATWYGSGSTFTIDVNITDGASHTVALYAIDWDNQSRAETITVTDKATGAVLDSQSLSGFQSGRYLVWNVKGSVRFSVKLTGGVNGVVSGLFFGGAAGTGGSAGGSTGGSTGGGSTAAAATFVKADTSTKGNWNSAYGKDGVAIAGDVTRYPSYATVAFSGASSWTWAPVTGDARALQNGAGNGRLAATWYESNGSFTIDVKITDGRSHQLALYLFDWDVQSRAETIQLTDAASGAVLDQRPVTSFQNGTYLVWNVSGNVRIRVTRTGGLNAIVNGLFFN